MHGKLPPSTGERSWIPTALARRGFEPIGRVYISDRATDLALALSLARVAVVRCVKRASAEDHTAVATMIAEGDFIWGALVYQQGEAAHSLGLIESFHVSQLDQLVTRLIELRDACREAG